MKKFLIAVCMGVMAMSLAACGTPVKYNEAAVEVIEFGSRAGVQETEITTGRYWAPPFSYRYIVKFPTTMQSYTFNEGSGENHCYSFINGDKVVTKACITLNVRINPGQADDIVRKYRGSITGKGGSDGYVLDDVIDGPVRREVQNQLNFIGVGYNTQQLYSDGGRALITDLQTRLKAKFDREGIVIEEVLWAAPPGLPADVVASIKGALTAQTDARKKDAEVASTIAEGRKTVAAAEAQARANDLLGASLRANPELLALREIERSRGLCPRGANVCVIGASPSLIDTFSR